MGIKDLLISDKATIFEAMAALDKGARKVLFIVKGEKQLVASLTDGDIRRWILSKGSLEATVREVANYSPKSLNISKKYMVNEYMKKEEIQAIPLVDDENNILAIEFINEELPFFDGDLNISVVINAGGKGTRLYPYTKILPKPLIPIGDTPISEHIINRFRKMGCTDFYMIVNHKKNMIKAYYNELEKDYNLTFIDEDIPLGTGGGVSLLKGLINSTFVLSNCDTIIVEDYKAIYDMHKKNNNTITMICSLKNLTIPYGVVDIGDQGAIQKLYEKPQMSFLTNTGCYIVEPNVIEDMVDGMSISFPDVVEKHKDKGNKVGIYPISEYRWMDMGQIDEMEKMIDRIGG